MKDIINLQYTTIKTPLPDFIYEGLKEYSRGANLYHPQPQILIDKLAKKYHLPPEMIYLTAGIDEALQMFMLAYGQRGVVFTPTYTVYTDIEEFGGKLTPVWSIQGDQYLIDQGKHPDATLIILANPNNPSGFTPKERVLELVANNTHCQVVIDEAYAEFADLTVIDQVKNHPHLAVLRSFSKDYSMAGNRIGYLVAHPQVIAQVKNKSTWSNVSYLSVGAAVVALDHEDYFKQIRDEINQRREKFINFLKRQKLTVFPSRINAVLIKFETEDRATDFVNYLNSKNIIVSHGNGNSNIGLDKSFVRISIGTAEQMSVLQREIEKY